MVAGLLFPGGILQAHPHVFVDGGIDFVMGDENTLEALEVTWRYDEFETLYILSVYGLELTTDGGLDEPDRQKLVQKRSKWPSEFDGSAHLSADGAPIALGRPVGFDAKLVSGRLEVSFSRYLHTPVDVSIRRIEVAFYEATYFYAFSVTDRSKILGSATCDTTLTPFDPNKQDKELLSVLAELSREETPAENNVGAKFADRIALQCA